LSCEIHLVRAPTPFGEAEGHIMGDENREPSINPAQSESRILSIHWPSACSAPCLRSPTLVL